MGFAFFPLWGIKLFFVLPSILVFAAPPILRAAAMRSFYQIGSARSPP